eukprot:3667151-Prymnesium_polylepis.1
MSSIVVRLGVVRIFSHGGGSGVAKMAARRATKPFVIASPVCLSEAHRVCSAVPPMIMPIPNRIPPRTPSSLAAGITCHRPLKSLPPSLHAPQQHTHSVDAA